MAAEARARIERHEPERFGLAASTTSQTLMPSRSHISAISFTRPMFTARNVFSSSFTISATRVELTGTTCRSTSCKAQATSAHSGVVPPITLGTLRV